MEDKSSTIINKVKNIHFTGIKGVGMTALALCAADAGMKVSGSDTSEKFITDEILETRKIKWQIGFSPFYIPKDTDLLVFTGAHGGEKNTEVVAARQRGIPVLSHAQALGEFMRGKVGISVCGVGGKTTTSAMIATVLEMGNLKPSFAVGVGSIFPLKAPGRYIKKGKYFIAEADEYITSPSDKIPRFFWQHPKIIVLTNIEHDHPDIYKNIKMTMKVFRNFIKRIPHDGLLVACIDNPHVVKLLQSIKVPVQTYGFSSEADWQIKNYRLGLQKITFWLKYKNSVYKNLTLKIPGKFNILNATASFVVARLLGVNPEIAKKGLEKFMGTKRRFEMIADVGGISLYDDYAHHPSEIRATLEAAKSWFAKKRIILIFQPHTYSRTKYLLKDFIISFNKANKVYITKIYASVREKDDLGISGEILAQKIKQQGVQAIYAHDCERVCQNLKKDIKKGDVILTMGAGDIFLWHADIIKVLRSKLV